MVRLISTALMLTIHYVLLNGYERTGKMIRKPYGPEMCKELCADSKGSFIYLKGDLSCRVLPPNSTSIMNSGSIGLIFTCLEKKMMKGTTARTYTLRNDSCLPHAKDPGERLSDQLSLSTNKGNVSYIYNEALHGACAEGNLCLIKYILFHKLAGINCRGKYERTPIMVAARAGQTSVFDFLVRQGCDLSTEDYYNDSLLHIACKGGNINIVRKLVHSGKCDIEGKGWLKWTPVMTAACYGNQKVFDFLVSFGCNLTAVDERTYNILHLASESGNIELVNYIMEMDIFDIESREIHGRTPVMIAVQNGHKAVFCLLVSKGCDVSAVDKQNNTILHLACLEDHADVVRYLLSQNITSIESEGDVGRTPFMYAVEKGRLRVAKLLVKEGCNITAVDKYQNTALHMACFGDHVAMVKYLLSLNKSSIDGRGFCGRTPFLVAAQKGNFRVVKTLIEKGCNVTAVDREENTALHLASVGDHVDIVRYLFTLEIFNTKEMNKFGQTPLNLAELFGHGEVIAFLKAQL